MKSTGKACWAVGTVLACIVSLQAAPVSYWALDDAPGSTSAANAIPGGPVGTLLNMAPAVWGPGQIGGALSFDGLDDVLQATLNVSEAQNTVSLWVRTASPNAGFSSVNNSANLGENDRNLYFSGGNVYGRIWSEETINSSASGINFADGAWHHVAHVYGPAPDGAGKHLLYVDGILRASGNKSTSNFNWQDIIRFGWANYPSGANYLNGSMDEIAVYDEPLSGNQVYALSQGTSPLSLPAASANTPARWINAGTGEWATPGFWDISAVPGPAHDTYVNNGGTAQITGATGTATPGALMIGGVGSGRVEVQAGGGLAVGGAIIVNANGQLDLAANASAGSLAGSGSVQIAPGAVMTTGSDNSSTTFSGTIAGGGGLTKVGTGHTTLGGGSANTLSGTTTLSAGKLILSKTAGVDAVAGNLTIAPSGGWQVGGVAANGVELYAGEQIADSAVITFSGRRSIQPACWRRTSKPALFSASEMS